MPLMQTESGIIRLLVACTQPGCLKRHQATKFGLTSSGLWISKTQATCATTMFVFSAEVQVCQLQNSRSYLGVI